MQSVTPFLWYDDQAEEAANRYVSIFSARPGSADRGPTKVLDVSRYGEAGPGAAGSVMTVSFMLDGVEFVGLNGGPQFPFSEAVSFVVHCESQEEVDYFWDALSQGGEHSQCGWLKDRYGLSWQVVPNALFDYVGGPDQEGSRRAMETMLGMQKLDIEALRRAYESK